MSDPQYERRARNKSQISCSSAITKKISKHKSLQYDDIVQPIITLIIPKFQGMSNILSSEMTMNLGLINILNSGQTLIQRNPADQEVSYKANDDVLTIEQSI